jgi:hypothetical protein
MFVAMAAFVINPASAATFFAPKGSEVTASVVNGIATVSWTGLQVAEVHQYRVDNSDGKGWILAYKPAGNSVTFNPYEGDRFQLVNAQGKFLFISPELAVSNYSPITFKGVVAECSHPKGCALQIAR